MDARILQHVMFFLLCVSCISDARITEKPSSEPFRESKKLDYENNQMVFSSQRIIPIVHQTIPDPTSPPSPIPSTTTPTISGGGGAWCIASTTASETALQVALDYACGYGGADCSAIQPGGSCSDPDTVRDHASYAFNDYYQKNPAPTSCVFGGTAQLTYTDPSHGNCRYASSTSSPMTLAPPTTIPTIPMPPPSTTTPVMPYTPGEGNGYGSEPTGGGYDYASGSEPTGTPSSASAISLDLLLLISLVVVANYLLTSRDQIWL